MVLSVREMPPGRNQKAVPLALKSAYVDPVMNQVKSPSLQET
jgi:hypothetical protein